MRPFHDGGGGTLVGRAYVLSGATGAEIRHHDNPLGSAGKNFGVGVAGIGDQTGDGVADYAIGDPGASRVHQFNGTTGAAIGTLATPGAAGDDFGAHIATSEDRSGDGRRDLWIGAPSGGKVYLETAGGTGLLTLTDPTPAARRRSSASASSRRRSPTWAATRAPTCSSANRPKAVIRALSTSCSSPRTGHRRPTPAPTSWPSARALRGTTVTLDGSGSSDPDGDTLTYTWTDAASNVVGNTSTVAVTLALGSYDVHA